jgi:hypothetical protein
MIAHLPLVASIAVLFQGTLAAPTVASSDDPTPSATYVGRENQLRIRVPRIDGPAASATVDGALDEDVW